MFKVNEQEKIGQYLSKLLKEKDISQREFGKQYLIAANEETTEENIGKMANKISQIIKGKKGIQTYDLPIFTELLDITCEELLSAGENFVPKANRMTNYFVAFSHDKEIWQNYIDHEDKLILNADEYGKTAIDYAIKFKNYTFLKFLIEKKYIWFDSRKDEDYIKTFGAGTSIERRDPHRIDDLLQYRLETEDKLRMDIVSLAIDQGDLKMLNELRAREIPALYFQAHYLSCTHPDFDSCYDEKLVRHVAAASSQILDYFTDEIEIRDQVKYKDGRERKHIFMFPFISELLNFAVEGKHDFAEVAIKKAIDHNKKTYETLKQGIDKSIETNLERISFGDAEYVKQIKPGCVNGVLHEFDFYKNGNIVSFRDPINVDGIITNIVHVVATANDIKLKYLIDELNDLYRKIINITDEFSITEE